MTTIETWEVTLDVDGRQVIRHERVEEPGLRQATAEVQAIRDEEAKGGKQVRCTRSRFLHEEPVR